MGRARLLGFFGAGGLSLTRVESAINRIQDALGPDAPYGFNFIHSPDHPAREDELVDLFFRYRVRQIEAAAFMGAKWWALDELLADQEPTVPNRLREFLPALVAGEIPDEPIDISPRPGDPDPLYRTE